MEKKGKLTLEDCNKMILNIETDFFNHYIAHYSNDLVCLCKAINYAKNNIIDQFYSKVKKVTKV